MYLYRATRDPTLLELGRDAVESIERISKVDCGFATVSAQPSAMAAKNQLAEGVLLGDVLPLSQAIILGKT